MDADRFPTVTNADELRTILGEVSQPARDKERTQLLDVDRAWLAASPFCFMATSDNDGACDVSPRGDPPGFTLILDDQTIALPERSGNRRGDSLHNLLANPHVGLNYLIPGRGDTLRINGRVTLVRDAPFFEDLVVKGHRPSLAIVVHIEQLFFHCSKAFLRSALWDPASWSPENVPSRANIAHEYESSQRTLEELQEYYGERYKQGLYE
ncbi:MAG: PPOX class probable FMN-dependent enzyme [Pseudohongiellaceae bacterium]|jgi:PPOX class probable FMN-dependent enzyme